MKKPGTLIVMDGGKASTPLHGIDYRHHSKAQHDPAQGLGRVPRVHRVFGNLLTWLRGTHHGVSHHHLQAYLGEFIFRFNRRRTPMAAFPTLSGLDTQYPHTTYNQLYTVESTR